MTIRPPRAHTRYDGNFIENWKSERCQAECLDDASCIQQCIRQLTSNQLSCPCMEKCEGILAWENYLQI